MKIKKWSRIFNLSLNKIHPTLFHNILYFFMSCFYLNHFIFMIIWLFPFPKSFSYKNKILNRMYKMECLQLPPLWGSMMWYSTKNIDLTPFYTSTLFMLKFNENWHHELDLCVQTHDLNISIWYADMIWDE